MAEGKMEKGRKERKKTKNGRKKIKERREKGRGKTTGYENSQGICSVAKILR